VLNPLVRILPEGQIPAEFAERPVLLERFALRGTVAWVPRSESDSLLPFWLSQRLEETLAAVTLEGNPSSKLRDEELSVLLAAGLVRTQEQADQEQEHWREMITRSAEMFQERDYAPIRNLIHPFHVAALRRYFRYVIRRGKIDLGDE